MQILFDNSFIKINIDKFDANIHLPKFTIWSKEARLKYKACLKKKKKTRQPLIRENLKSRESVLTKEESVLIGS